MNKPEIPSMLPSPPATSGRVVPVPQALVQQSAPVDAVRKQGSIPPTRPTSRVGTSAYVDPYLFETGYYASPAEHEALTRTAASRIQLRADVENARPKRRS